MPPPIGGVNVLPPKTVEPGDSLVQPRVRAKLSFTGSSGGWVPLLTVANVSSIPLYLENPHLILTREADNSEDLPSDLSPELGNDSVEGELFPTSPVSGPLLPTQQRTYFLHPEALRLLQNDERFFGVSTPSIRIATAVSEELVLDDPESVRSLKSLLGFPGADADLHGIRMPVIMGLVHKRCSDQAEAPYKVYPPQEVVDDPSVVESEDVVERLKDKQFQVVFNDGVSEILSLPELMVFTQNLIFIKIQVEETLRQLKKSQTRSNVQLKLTTNIFPHLAMHPDMVRLLFSKISLEPVSFINRD